MEGREGGGDLGGVNVMLFKPADDRHAGVPFVFSFDLLTGQLSDAGNRAGKVVGVGGSEARQVAAQLCEDGGIGRMGMYDGVGLRKVLIEGAVDIEIN